MMGLQLANPRLKQRKSAGHGVRQLNAKIARTRLSNEV